MATAATRLMAMLVLAAGALVAGMMACPEWFTGHGGGHQVSASAGLGAPPDEKAVLITHRINQRVAIARQVLAGEMGLLEAAAVFKRLGSDAPEPIRNSSWLTMPGRSEGEKLCRQVLLWTEGELHDTVSPQEASDRIAAMEDELARAIGPDGRVVLPY